MEKLKIYFDIDELYPYFSFGKVLQSYGNANNAVELSKREWKDFNKKAKAFWKAYDKLTAKAGVKQNENNKNE